MKVQAGPNAGLTYKEFATKRLAELIADPAKSNNGAGPLAGTGLFSGGQASNKPYTITTGFNGTPNILPALTKNGDAATAYKLFSSDKFASWLYPVTLGATSMWELWNSYERGLGQGGDSTMNSQNHFALGASQAWMYEYQLGITSNGAKGYRDFVLQPTPGGEFTSLKGGFQSSYGFIDSAWTASNGKLTSYSTTVPANTTATLYLPVEGEVTAAAIPGATFEGMDKRNGQTVAKFTLGAGGYTFKVDGSTVAVTLDSDWVVDEGSTPTEEPTPTPTTPVPTTTPTTPAPTTTPTPTPAVSPKVTVKGKVRAGKALKIRIRDLAVNKVSITLAGKKLGTVKVKDGKVAVDQDRAEEPVGQERPAGARPSRRGPCQDHHPGPEEEGGLTTGSSALS